MVGSVSSNQSRFIISGSSLFISVLLVFRPPWNDYICKLLGGHTELLKGRLHIVDVLVKNLGKSGKSETLVKFLLFADDETHQVLK